MVVQSGRSVTRSTDSAKDEEVLHSDRGRVPNLQRHMLEGLSDRAARLVTEALRPLRADVAASHVTPGQVNQAEPDQSSAPKHGESRPAAGAASSLSAADPQAEWPLTCVKGMGTESAAAALAELSPSLKTRQHASHTAAEIARLARKHSSPRSLPLVWSTQRTEHGLVPVARPLSARAHLSTCAQSVAV